MTHEVDPSIRRRQTKTPGFYWSGPESRYKGKEGSWKGIAKGGGCEASACISGGGGTGWGGRFQGGGQVIDRSTMLVFRRGS